MATTAAPTTASTIGLKDVVIAPVTADTAVSTTYGTLQALAGAIDVQLAPDNAEPEVQYADDIEFDVVTPDPSIKLTMEMADMPLAIQEMVFGHTIDEAGVLVKTAGDAAGYFALGFRSIKANGKYRYVWLYKGRCAPQTETYHTKEGQTVTRQTGKAEWTFIKRTSDGHYQAVADEGENGFVGGATFLATVYTPDFTP